MSKPSKRRKKPASAKRDRAPSLARRAAGRLPGAMLALLRFTVRAAPMALLLGGTAVAATWLWLDASAAGRFRVEPRERPLLSGTAPLDLKIELDALEDFASGLDLLDPDAPLRLRRAYERSGWIAGTKPFRRDFAGRRVHAEAEIRRPLAQVRFENRYWTVDREGVLLPMIRTETPRLGLPVIYCSLPEKPAEGEPWPSRELRDALGVLARVRQSVLGEKLRIDSLVVRSTSYLDSELQRCVTRPSIDLYPVDGSVIRWGTYNTDPSSPELLADEKIEMLRRILAETQALRPGASIDVRTRSAFYADDSSGD